MELRPTDETGVEADETRGIDADGRTWLARESALANTIQGAPEKLGAPPRRGAKDVLEQGAHVGRYMILEWVGEGGMGVVYAAYDPQLDRKVALKLVIGASPELTSSQRLLREAQALARLAHPNVVSVHDVGEVHGQLFIAMEFVEGQTLGAWARAERSVEERLAVLRAAGRGLAAAHAGDLLHRDFKPENVMVGEDGRVRVMDFGLARSGSSHEDFEVTLEVEASADLGERRSVEDVRTATVSVAGVGDGRVSALATNMTRTGAMMGTPAYMAPELFLNGKSDARSDQYAYFVVVFEVLYGAHPYEAKSLGQLLVRAEEGAAVTVPVDPRVPGAVRRAIERGLSADPDERFADMDDALLALREDRGQGSGRRASAVGVVALIAGLSWFSWLSAAGTTDPCAAAAEAATRSWDEQARASIRAAFGATEAPFATPTGERAIEALDRVGSSHAALRRRVCEATHVEATQSAALLDRRMECLDARRLRFESMISVLGQADLEVAKNALEAISELPPASECMLITSGEELRPPPPPELEAEVTRLRKVIARAHAQLDAGTPQVALRSLEGEEEAIARVDYLPLTAEFANVQAIALQSATGGSATDFIGALALSLELGDDELNFRNMGELIPAATLAEDWEAAEHWLTLTEAVVARRGDRLADRIILERKTARIKRSAGERLQAQEHIELALDLQRELDPEDTLALGTLHLDAGHNYTALGQMTEAERHFEEALVAYRRHLGEDHPSLAEIYLGLGRVARIRGDYDRAIASLERGVEMTRRAYGSESRALGNLYGEIAVVLTALERFDEAEGYFQRVLGLYEGDPGSALAYNGTLGNYGAMLWFAGRYEDALVPQRELVRLYLANPDAPPLAIGMAEGNLASTLSSLDRHEESLALHRSALARFESVLTRDDPTLAVAHFDQSMPLLALERFEEALAVLERAESIYARKRADGDPAQLADVRVTMVEALRPESIPANRERAQALAEAVFAELPQLGPRGADFVERLRAAGISPAEL